jgi:hypothetical protein
MSARPLFTSPPHYNSQGQKAVSQPCNRYYYGVEYAVPQRHWVKQYQDHHWTAKCVAAVFRFCFNGRTLLIMKSLKRNLKTDSQSNAISSKTFVRSTRNGKIQKVVSEIYLRSDITCSSELCSICPSTAPADANGNGM